MPMNLAKRLTWNEETYLPHRNATKTTGEEAASELFVDAVRRDRGG